MPDTPPLEFMSVLDVLRNYEPAYGDSWVHAFQILMEDPFESEILCVLADDLLLHGVFREPVWLHDESGSIGNGMHRLVAAALCAVSEVNVTHEPSVYDNYPMWDAVFTVDAEPSDEVFDDVTSILRSFPYQWSDDSGNWMEAIVCGFLSGAYSFTYPCPESELEPLREHIFTRMLEAGYAVAAFRWELAPED